MVDSASQSHPEKPPVEGVYGLSVSPEDARVVLIPVPWEATTSYGRGTAAGPAAIERASVQVDLFDLGLADRGLPEPADEGIVMLPPSATILAVADEAAQRAQRVIDRYHAGDTAGPDDADLARVNELSLELNREVEQLASAWRQRGKLVGIVGGDHSVAFGGIAAAAAEHPGMGVLQIDAHADLRVAYQGFTDSHASVMYNVVQRIESVSKLVSLGVRDFSRDEYELAAASQGRIRSFFEGACVRRLQAGTTWQAICDEVAQALPHDVYVSFDIDGLDPALCPNTGTPVPGGLSFAQADALLSALARAEKRIVGFDLCEVAPGNDEWDANVGARILYKLIGYALVTN